MQPREKKGVHFIIQRIISQFEVGALGSSLGPGNEEPFFLAHFHSEPLQVSVPATFPLMLFLPADHVPRFGNWY